MRNSFDESIGAAIRRARLLRGLTQQQLARMLEVSFQQVQKYEMGANKISFERLCRLSRLLDVPLSQWLAPEDQLPAGNGEQHRQLLGLMQHYKAIANPDHRTLLADLARALAG